MNRSSLTSSVALAAMLMVGLSICAPSHPALAAPACIGDCDGDGTVTVNEIITMVNIALGASLSACPAGDADGSGDITINEIVAAVNNALGACPVIATPTATALATVTPTTAATFTPPPSTATATPQPTVTSPPTATTVPTTTAVPSATNTVTAVPTTTATLAPTATAVPSATSTPTSSLTPTVTATPSRTVTSTATASATIPATATFTPTQTPVPGAALEPAASASGRISIAVDSVTVISNVIAAVASGVQFGTSAQVYGSPFSPLSSSTCPLGGTVNKTGDLFSGETFTFNDCKVPTFDGSVTFTAGSTASISLGSGDLSVGVTSLFKDQNGVLIQTTTANLSGSAVITPDIVSACLVKSVDFTITGTLASTIPNGPTVSATFDNTQLTFKNITFSASCVPTVYDMVLDGDAALASPGGSENVTFDMLVIHVNSASNPTVLTINGGMSAPCFNGAVVVSTQTSLSVPSGSNCPTAGVLIAMAAGGQAQITFQADTSVIIQATGAPTVTAPNCLDPRLLMCLA